jgi:hypothetical protein
MSGPSVVRQEKYRNRVAHDYKSLTSWSSIFSKHAQQIYNSTTVLTIHAALIQFNHINYMGMFLKTVYSRLLLVRNIVKYGIYVRICLKGRFPQ